MATSLFNHGVAGAVHQAKLFRPAIDEILIVHVQASPESLKVFPALAGRQLAKSVARSAVRLPMRLSYKVEEQSRTSRASSAQSAGFSCSARHRMNRSFRALHSPSSRYEAASSGADVAGKCCTGGDCGRPSLWLMSVLSTGPARCRVAGQSAMRTPGPRSRRNEALRLRMGDSFY